MTNLLQNIKQKFESKHKKCPVCGTRVSKTAEICSECGHSFLFAEEMPKSFSIRLDRENCCSIFLLILIALAFLFVAFPFIKTIFLIIGVAALVFILIILILFARLVFKIRKFFGF